MMQSREFTQVPGESASRAAANLDEALERSSEYDRHRDAALRLGARPDRCQSCENTGELEVQWSDAFSAFLCLDCYEGRTA